MNKTKVLFISHPKKQCGVFEFGKNIYRAIADSEKYEFIWIECSSLIQLRQSISLHNPAAIIYNYHPATMPWLCNRKGPKLYKNNVHDIRVLQIGIIHEITQELADSATNYRKPFIIGGSNKLANVLFDYYIAADPRYCCEILLYIKQEAFLPIKIIFHYPP
ncbi:MAG: hypothetical protein WKI04_07190 [Ferruginibacter sp.]